MNKPLSIADELNALHGQASFSEDDVRRIAKLLSISDRALPRRDMGERWSAAVVEEWTAKAPRYRVPPAQGVSSR